ncbi:MAG: DUF3750 domain-containing protein [Hyphomicrobiales bacterium]
MRFISRIIRLSVILGFVFIALPIATSAVLKYQQGWPSGWSGADWSATNTAPDPAVERDAIIRVYAARTGRWKSVFAVHSWIAIKPKDAPRWTRFDVVGWGRPLRQDAYAVDARWYSNPPHVVHEIKGEQAEKLIPEVIAAIQAYPYGSYGDYRIWPGPNSNTFVATIVRAVPGLDATLPATAVGKDFLGNGLTYGPMPSKTGGQISWSGIIGAGLSWEEGAELHLLGGTLGVNPLKLSVSLPGLGRLSLKDEAVASEP